MANLHIGIAGNIGVGKSTLAGYLEREPSRTKLLSLQPSCEELKVFEESIAKNDFLPYYYASPERFGLDSQLFFLIERLKQQAEIKDYPGIAIEDRILFEDRIFAEINFQDSVEPGLRRFAREFQGKFDLDEHKIPNVNRFYDNIIHFFQKYIQFNNPDLVVYLRVADVDVLVERELARGRDFEKGGLTREYLQRLNKGYDHTFYSDHSIQKKYRVPILAINAETNFNHKKSFLCDVCDEIIEKIKEIKG